MVNKVYHAPETAITWQDTTTPAFGLNALASGTGQQGAEKDLGSASRSRRYRYRAWVQFATTPVPGEGVQVFLKTGDGTNYDNDDGTGDIPVSAANKLKNLMPLGVIVVDEAAINVPMSISGELIVSDRYVMPVFWNDTADGLRATNDTSGFTLIPVPDEIQ